MKLLAEVIIPNYLRKIKISDARRATYYKQGEKLPDRIKNKIGVDFIWIQFEEGTILCNAKKEPIIKNKKSVGTPKYLYINGQDLHALTLKDYQRSKIIKAIKEQMIPEVEKLEPITEFPIRILCELYDTFEDEEIGSGQKWDIDNRFLHFQKVFPDVLCGCPTKNKEGKLVSTTKVIIPDDNRRYITQPPVPLFFPISSSKDRKLVFKIYHDDRECILNNKDYE